jgi:cystine transport system substrate-binding protein
MRRGALLAALVVATLATMLPASGRADDLPEIRARGYLKIGTSGTAPPNTWVDAKNQLTGYDIDWGNMISRELGLPVRWIKVDFRGLLPALSSGQLDLVITGVRIRDQLKKVFLFSEPYAYERMVGVVRSDDRTTRSLDDIRGHTVGVVAASFQEDTIRRMGGYRALLTMPSGSDVFLSLHTGHIDIAVVGLTAAIHYERARPGEVRILQYGGGVNAQGIVMQKSAVALKEAVDHVVERARADGTYLALYRKNFGIDPPQ